VSTSRLRDMLPEFASLDGLDEAYRRQFPFAVEALAVARLRGSLGLTQAQLAERAGTTQSVIARLESGRHPIEVRLLHRIADAVGLPLRLGFGADAEGGRPSDEGPTAHRSAEAPAAYGSDGEADGDGLLAAFNAANTSGDLRRASRIARRIAREATTPRRRLALALASFNERRYDDAARWAAEALAGGLPHDRQAIARHVLGRARLRMGDPGGAVRTLRPVAGPGSADWLAVGALAEAELEAGHPTLAWRAAQRALELSGGRPEAHFLVARIGWHTDRVAEALEHITLFRAALPDDPDGQLLHGAVLGYLGDAQGDRSTHARALRIFTRAIRRRPEEALRACGVTAARLGRWRQAFRYAERLLGAARSPRARAVAELEVNAIVSEALDGIRAPDAAREERATREAVQEAERLFGRIDAVRTYLAAAAAASGDAAAVLRTLGIEAAKLDEADPPVRFLVAIAHDAAGEPERALEILRRLPPSATPERIDFLHARVALEAGEHEEAARLLERIAAGAGLVAETASLALRLAAARLEAAGPASLRTAWAETGQQATGEPSARRSAWEGRHRPGSAVMDRLTMPGGYVH
jgi:transcriptional regulator with XRE-family HTH domain